MFLLSLHQTIYSIMAKNLLNKYVWLVETIYKAKRITFEEINEKWLDNDMSEGVELALRTFHKWRIAVEEMFGLVIECERKGGYHYYIENANEIKSGSLRSWLLSTISVSNLLIENQNMKDRILLEDVPSGQEYLSTIIEAMKKNNVIRIEANDGKLSIFSSIKNEDGEDAAGSESIEARCSGVPQRLFLNAEFLKDAVKSQDGDELSLEMSGREGVIYVNSETGRGFLMPVRVAD